MNEKVDNVKLKLRNAAYTVNSFGIIRLSCIQENCVWNSSVSGYRRLQFKITGPKSPLEIGLIFARASEGLLYLIEQYSV